MVSSSRAQATGEVEFRRIFDLHFDYVWISLRRLGVPERDRDDLTTEVFLRVHRRFAEYDPARPPKPWLFAFAVRLAADYRRLARHRHEIFDETAQTTHADATPAADEHIGRQEENSFLLRLLDTLDDDKRAVFVLHELDEEPIPAVAAALGILPATAYSRLRAARAEIAQAAQRMKGSRP